MIEIEKDFLPLNRPSIGEAEIAAVTACLKSRWITTGPLCRSFEERFQALTGARHAVSVVLRDGRDASRRSWPSASVPGMRSSPRR